VRERKEVRGEGGLAVKAFQFGLVAQDRDLFSEGVGYLAKAGFQDVEDVLAQGLHAAFLTAQEFDVGDVGHALFPFQIAQLAPELNGEFFGEHEQPVNQAVKLEDVLLGVAAFAKATGEFSLQTLPLGEVGVRALGGAMGGDDDGGGIVGRASVGQRGVKSMTGGGENLRPQQAAAHGRLPTGASKTRGPNQHFGCITHGNPGPKSKRPHAAIFRQGAVIRRDHAVRSRGDPKCKPGDCTGKGGVASTGNDSEQTANLKFSTVSALASVLKGGLEADEFAEQGVAAGIGVVTLTGQPAMEFQFSLPGRRR